MLSQKFSRLIVKKAIFQPVGFTKMFFIVYSIQCIIHYADIRFEIDYS
jgi:hypothetical protein